MNSLLKFSNESISGVLDKIVLRVTEVVQPDVIYLLGGTICNRYNESIFSDETTPTNQVEGCTLLILINNLGNKRTSHWQDKVEQYCKTIATITTIILETSLFTQWLMTKHPFATTVQHSAKLIYNLGNLLFRKTSEEVSNENKAEIKKYVDAAIAKSKEFLAGAELFQLRKQYGVATFMLHQAIEQSLLAVLKLGTGYYPNTHNLDRLIRYASLIAPELRDIFPRRTDEERKLFSLLQKAYIDTRYKLEYAVKARDFLQLADKARHIQKITTNMYTNANK